MSTESETRLLAENMLLRQQKQQLIERLEDTNAQLKSIAKMLNEVHDSIKDANDRVEREQQRR